MRRLPHLLIASVGLSVICAIGILIGIYPYRPNSVIGWIVLFLVGLPIVLVGEAVGDRLLENRFVAKMSRWARMTYAVILGCILIFGLVVLTKSDAFNQYFAPWGS